MTRRIVTMTLHNADQQNQSMKTNIAVRDMLELYGWRYTGNCNCNGQYNDKYELKAGGMGLSYQMKVRRSNFLLRHPNTNVFKKYPISELKQTVDEIKAISE